MIRVSLDGMCFHYQSGGTVRRPCCRIVSVKIEHQKNGQGERIMDKFDDVLVIDADGHVYEGNVDLASRMPEKWRSQAPVRLKDNQGNSRIMLEGRLWSASQGPGPGVSG